MNEKKLQKKIVKFLMTRKIYYIKTVVSTRRGVPDIIVCSKSGRFVAIEVKGDGKLPTPLQKYNLDVINKTNGKAVCINSDEGLEDYLTFLCTK